MAYLLMAYMKASCFFGVFIFIFIYFLSVASLGLGKMKSENPCMGSVGLAFISCVVSSTSRQIKDWLPFMSKLLLSHFSEWSSFWSILQGNCQCAVQ